MATVRETVKHSLLRFPTLYTSPVQVLVHLFAVLGNGLEWYRGELVSGEENSEEFKNPKMKYEDRWPVKDDEFLKSLNIGYKLKNLAFRKQCEFVEENIEDILDAPLTNSYFGERASGYYFLRGICYDQVPACAFRFPNNIKPDWAKTLYEFFEHWLTALNHEYGVSQKDYNDRSFWPEDIQKAREAIVAARKRLHPLAYNGQTWEQYEENCRKTAEMLKTIWNKPVDKDKE